MTIGAPGKSLSRNSKETVDPGGQRGDLEGGVKEIFVADGHGPGGIKVKMLNPREKLMRGRPAGFPFLLDKSYDKVLVPGIETVSVKKGTTPGKGDDLTTEMYGKRNLSAIHLRPVKARELIKKGAFRAVKDIKKDRSGKIISLQPPFKSLTIFRAGGNSPKTISRESHPDSIAALLDLPFEKKPAENTIRNETAAGKTYFKP